MSQDLRGIDVANIPEFIYRNLYLASYYGYCVLQDNDGKVRKVNCIELLEYINKNKNGTADAWKTSVTGGVLEGVGGALDATVILAPIGLVLNGLGGAVFGLGSNRVATIVIANALAGDLRKVGEIYIDHGLHTGYPTGAGADVIPARHDVDLGGGITDSRPGLGIYRFEKDMSSGFGWYGTGGAIALESDDHPHLIGIAWQVPQSGEPSFYTTANLSHYDNDPEKLFNATCDNDKSHLAEYKKKLGTAVHASSIDLSDGDTNNMLYMVSVEKIIRQQKFHDGLGEAINKLVERGDPKFKVLDRLSRYSAIVSDLENLFEAGMPVSAPRTREVADRPLSEGAMLRLHQRGSNIHFHEESQGHQKQAYRVIGPGISYETWWGLGDD